MNLEVMASLPVPVVAVVIGEGGSGGALALGVANRVLMLEYSIYSVISPGELQRDPLPRPAKAQKSAEALKLTARDLAGFGITDELVREAPGGAHRDPALTARNLGEALRRHLAELRRLSPGAAGRRSVPPLPGDGRLLRGGVRRPGRPATRRSRAEARVKTRGADDAAGAARRDQSPGPRGATV